MIFFWIWTLGILGMSFSRLNKIPWREYSGWILGLWFAFGALLFSTDFELVGHEAEYLRFFYGETPVLGDTTLYPSMQIWWYGWSWLSSVLSEPLLHSSFFGAAAITLLAGVLEKKFEVPKWRSVLFFGTIPLLWGWSLSVYNVIVPFFFLSLALWYLVFKQPAVLVMSSFALAVSMRIELIVFLPVLLYWFWQERGPSKQYILAILPIVSMLSMMSNEIPGEGERWLAWQNNWHLWEYYEPLYWTAPFILWSLLRRTYKNNWWLGAVILLVLNHVLMTSFNDFSPRHLLIAIIPIAFLAAPILRTRFFWLILGGNLLSMVSFWQSFYAEEDSFQKFLAEEHTALPHYSLEEARRRGCAWVVEMEPFISEEEPRILSHFNLLNSKEREDLRKDYSCIDWCVTLQDWQWSSLGVHARAIRLKKMFELKDIAIVQAKGQQCLLYSVREK